MMTTTHLLIDELCCPSEGEPTARALRAIEGVTDVTMNYALRRVTVAHNAVDETRLIDTVRSLGFSARVEVPTAKRHTLSVPALCCEGEVADCERAAKGLSLENMVCNPLTRTVMVTADEATLASFLRNLKRFNLEATPINDVTTAPDPKPFPFVRCGVALGIAFLSEVLDLILEYRTDWLPTLLQSGVPAHLMVMIPAVIALAMAGLTTMVGGLRALLHGNLNMNALMSVAVIGGFAIGAYPEAAMVLVLFEISEAIEDLSLERARKSIRALMNTTPETALVQTAPGSFEAMPVAAIGPGALVRVAPGERVPLDGRIRQGSTGLDQSMVTGEGLPADKTVGDTVWAGTVNLTATIDIVVTAAASESLTARIIHAVENAQQSKSPVQRFVDRFARVYTPMVFAVALGVALIPPVFLGAEWLDWIYKALVMLVIACPCALVISTPVTVVSALATATRCGLLIKGGLYLEEARHLKVVALDKTGTLTRGEPEVVGVVWLTKDAREESDQLAASLAGMNQHPLSQALTRRARHQNIPTSNVTGFKALPGAGVEGRVQGALVRLVNLRWLEEAGLATDAVREAFASYAKAGCSATALVDLFGVRVVYGFADQLKSDALEGLKQLESVGLTPWLLTGDNEAAAATLGRETGLKHIEANLLPEDKLRWIERLQEMGPTAMVGDGINDAPALARADIGIAMGVKGTDSAMEAAHVALMDDKISSIATLVRLSRLTHRVLLQNITFALAVKFGFMLLAVSGLATMWMAVFADTGTCLIVVANGMRLLNKKAYLDRLAKNATA